MFLPSLPGIGLSTIPLRQFLRVNDWEEGCANGTLSSANHTELVKGLRWEDSLESPEDPCHERWYVDKELECL